MYFSLDYTPLLAEIYISNKCPTKGVGRVIEVALNRGFTVLGLISRFNRLDPRFMSPQLSPKKNYHERTKGQVPDEKYLDQFIDSGAVSDESIQVKGCFLQVCQWKHFMSAVYCFTFLSNILNYL